MIAESFTVEPATWEADADALRTIRERVFIVEQQVPADEEWDAADAKSRHALARAPDGEPIGCGRLTPDHAIGRMAVVAAWRGRGVGAALMHVLLEQARALRWTELHLHAQVHAIAFYERFGFEAHGEVFDECGIAHRLMRATLAPTAGRSAPPPPPAPASIELIATDRDQALTALGILLADARHDLAIYTRDLDPTLLDVGASLDAIKRVALSGRNARVRIIVQDPRKAIVDGHRLIALAHRLPSAIALRTPTDERDLQYPSAFVVNDARGYLFRTLGGRVEAEGATYAPGRHAQLRDLFEQMWERASPSEHLRLLAF